MAKPLTRNNAPIKIRQEKHAQEWIYFRQRLQYGLLEFTIILMLVYPIVV